MNVPSVGFDSKNLENKILPEGTEISLKSFTVLEKCDQSSVSSSQKKEVHCWFQKARGHHH